MKKIIIVLSIICVILLFLFVGVFLNERELLKQLNKVDEQIDKSKQLNLETCLLLADENYKDIERYNEREKCYIDAISPR